MSEQYSGGVVVCGWDPDEGNPFEFNLYDLPSGCVDSGMNPYEFLVSLVDIVGEVGNYIKELNIT